MAAITAQELEGQMPDASKLLSDEKAEAKVQRLEEKIRSLGLFLEE